MGGDWARCVVRGGLRTDSYSGPLVCGRSASALTSLVYQPVNVCVAKNAALCWGFKQVGLRGGLR